MDFISAVFFPAAASQAKASMLEENISLSAMEYACWDFLAPYL